MHEVAVFPSGFTTPSEVEGPVALEAQPFDPAQGEVGREPDEADGEDAGGEGGGRVSSGCSGLMFRSRFESSMPNRKTRSLRVTCVRY